MDALLVLARDAGVNITLSATNATTTNASNITPTFVKIVSPWMPTIDTLATIAGDGIGLIVKIVQLGVVVRQLHSLFRFEEGESSCSPFAQIRLDS
jgi:hypothetical protein